MAKKSLKVKQQRPQKYATRENTESAESVSVN